MQFAFASQAVEAKLAMMPRALGGEEIFPEALAMIRMLGGALFFQAILGLRKGAAASISRADHVRLAGLSIVGIALNQTLFLMGLRWTTPFSASILGATIPIFAAGLAVLFGKESSPGGRWSASPWLFWGRSRSLAMGHSTGERSSSR